MISANELTKFNCKTVTLHFTDGETETGIFHCYTELDDETDDIIIKFRINSFVVTADEIDSVEEIHGHTENSL